MHTINAYAYNSVTQENNKKNQTVNKKQQSINNWSWHIPDGLKWGGSEGITQTERGTCWWKLILKGRYLLWGAEKDSHICAVNTYLV